MKQYNNPQTLVHDYVPQMTILSPSDNPSLSPSKEVIYNENYVL